MGSSPFFSLMMSCLGLQEAGGELFQLLFIGRVVQGRHLVVLYHHLREKWSGKLIQFLQRGVRMGLAEQVDIEFVALNQYALCKGVLLGSIDGKLIVVLVKKMSGLSPGCKFGWSVKILLLTLRRSALLMPSVSRLPPVAEVFPGLVAYLPFLGHGRGCSSAPPLHPGRLHQKERGLLPGFCSFWFGIVSTF